MRYLAALCGLLCSFFSSGALADASVSGDLPRRSGRPLEEIAGVDSYYGVLRARDGTRLRTILTRPADTRGRLPAILFVQWLSCDSIELPASQQDGWSEMLRGLASRSGIVMARTEKAGVGDSEGGPCAELDYDSELEHHRDALAALRSSEHVDPERIVVLGASMGANMAPLLAADENVAGVMIWGGGAKSWFERTLGFERRAKELEQVPAGELDDSIKLLTRFLVFYLIDQETPTEIAREHPRLAGVWRRMVGTDLETHYGRPVAFHQQAQARNWPAAWARVSAPVLVLYGEYDWYEDAVAHELVADIVNRRRPGAGELVVLEGTDHHFVRYPTQEAAFAETGGSSNAHEAVQVMLRWLHATLAR